MERKNEDVNDVFIRKCIGLFLAFISMVLLFVMALTIVLSMTLFNSSYVSTIIQETNYGRLLTSEIKSDLQDLASNAGNLPASIFLNVITEEQVIKDSADYCKASFSGEEFIPDTDKMASQLENNIHQYVQNTDLTDVDLEELENNISVFVDACVSTYRSDVMISLLPTVGRYISEASHFLPFILLAEAVLMIGLGVSVKAVVRKGRTFVRYCIYAVLGCLVFIVAVNLLVFFSNVIPRLGVTSESLYVLVTTSLFRFINYLWFAAGAFALIAVILFIISIELNRAALREGTTRRSHKKEYAKPRTTLIAIPPEDPEDHMSFDQPNQTGKG